MSEHQTCSKCGSPSLKWDTLRAQVPVDVLQCSKCGHPEIEEDWVAPILPLHAGRCLNCGDRRAGDVCSGCGLTAEEDDQVHDELRELVAPQYDLFNAARVATRSGRHLLALKLATAAAAKTEPPVQENARALRVWLLARVGEGQAALDDAQSWVDHARDPSHLAWAMLAQQQQQNDMPGQAAESYLKALQRDPSQHKLRARRARLLFEMNRDGQAAEESCTLFELGADDGSIDIGLEVVSKIAYKLESGFRDDEIARLLTRAGTYVERSPHLLAQRARLAALDGDEQTARKDLKRARRLDPDLEIYERIELTVKPQRNSWWRW